MDDDTLASGASGAPPIRHGNAPLAAGSTFAGEFRVLRMIGRGGMGAVYAVEQLATGRERALKLMDAGLVADPRSRDRFLQEARVGSRIQSEHVVEVVDAGVDRETGAPWLAMELLQGETLAERLAARGALAPADAWEILRQLGHALGAAHAAGIVHRDVKPENVFLARPRRSDARETVKVLDFGIAKLLQGAAAAGHTTAAVGSPMWMAPEQTGAGTISPAADVWSLGLLAFQLLTGRLYWKTAHQPDAPLGALLTEMLVEEPAPATTRAATWLGTPVLPAGFDAWFARCVVRDPASRFRDAAEAVAALGPVLGAATPAAAAAEPPVPLRTPTVRLPRGAGTTTGDAARAVEVTAAPAVAAGGTASSGGTGRWRAMVPVAAVVAVVAVVAAVWLLRGRDGERRTPERGAEQVVARAPDDDRPADAGATATEPPAAPADAADATASTGANVEPGPADAGAAAAPEVDAGAAAETGAVEAAAADAGSTAAAEAAVAADAGGRHLPGGRMTPAARQFHNAIVLPCWRDNPPAVAERVVVGFRVTYNQFGGMHGFRVQGDVSDQFKRCVGLRGQSFRFDPLPPEAAVVWRTVLVPEP